MKKISQKVLVFSIFASSHLSANIAQAVTSGRAENCQRNGVVQLINFKGGVCSGFFVSPNLVITAGHCMIDTNQTTIRYIDQTGKVKYVISTDTVVNSVSLDKKTSLDDLQYQDAAALVFPKDTAQLLGVQNTFKWAERSLQIGDKINLMGYGFPRFTKEDLVLGKCFVGSNKISEISMANVQNFSLPDRSYSTTGPHFGNPDFMQSTTLPGDSGSPLLNSRGEWVGISTQSYFSRSGTGIVISYFTSAHNQAVRDVMNDVLNLPNVQDPAGALARQFKRQ